jgi:hypothetical protein
MFVILWFLPRLGGVTAEYGRLQYEDTAMTEKLWAEIDEDWRRKEERALAQRAANQKAAREGKPLPYPNPFDRLDPTKLPPDASPSQIMERHRKFREICRPFQPKRHTI